MLVCGPFVPHSCTNVTLCNSVSTSSLTSTTTLTHVHTSSHTHTHTHTHTHPHMLPHMHPPTHTHTHTHTHTCSHTCTHTLTHTCMHACTRTHTHTHCFIGTDNGSITVNIWNDLCTLIGSHDQMSGCKLGLQQIQDSIKLLSSNYVQLRMTSEQTLYSLLVSKYVPVIGGFVRGLCQGVIERWAEAVSMETEDCSEGVFSSVPV